MKLVSNWLRKTNKATTSLYKAKNFRENSQFFPNFLRDMISIRYLKIVNRELDQVGEYNIEPGVTIKFST